MRWVIGPVMHPLLCRALFLSCHGDCAPVHGCREGSPDRRRVCRRPDGLEHANGQPHVRYSLGQATADQCRGSKAP